MSVAGRHAKLVFGEGQSVDRWERIEDLLTADVFGAYRYLPVAAGIGALLARATMTSGATLKDWLAENGSPLAAHSRCRLYFWPELAGKEPDVIVLLDGPGAEPVAVLVEAKLHSPQHTIDGRSQLGFYAIAFARGLLEHEGFSEPLPRLRPVVFLTRHHERPDAELLAASSEVSGMEDWRHTGDSDESVETAIFWVNWQTALALAADEWALRAAEADDHPHWRVLEDLVADLEARAISKRKRVSLPLPNLRALPRFLPPTWGPRSIRRTELRSFAQVQRLALAPQLEELRNWKIRK